MAHDILDTAYIREQFPPLKDGWVFVENAGGTYVPRQVIDRTRDYMTETQVQPNWNFASSVRATDRIAAGKHLMAEFIRRLRRDRARAFDHHASICGAGAAAPVQAGDEIRDRAGPRAMSVLAPLGEIRPGHPRWVDRETGACAPIALFVARKLVAFTHAQRRLDRTTMPALAKIQLSALSLSIAWPSRRTSGRRQALVTSTSSASTRCAARTSPVYSAPRPAEATATSTPLHPRRQRRHKFLPGGPSTGSPPAASWVSRSTRCAHHNGPANSFHAGWHAPIA
jgi:hypothetical protein